MKLSKMLKEIEVDPDFEMGEKQRNVINPSFKDLGGLSFREIGKAIGFTGQVARNDFENFLKKEAVIYLKHYGQSVTTEKVNKMIHDINFLSFIKDMVEELIHDKINENIDLADR